MRNLLIFSFVVILFIFNSLEMSSQEKIEIIGMAYDVKGGAIVQTDSIDYWIDGKDSWEEHYSQKKVKVIGDLKYRKDNRVFVDTGDLKMQGIPVSSKDEKDNYPEMIWIVPSKIEVLE